MVLTECILMGRRCYPGEWITVQSHRVRDFVALGYVMPDAFVDRMPVEVAAMWRLVGSTRPSLTDGSLVADEETVAQLWASSGRILSPDAVPSHYQPAEPGVWPIRVLQLTQYDPGSAVYRYHSAANTVPGIQSAFVRFGHSNPHCHLRQWDGDLHRRTVELLAMTADVIHVHMDYRTLHHDLRYALHANQRAAITYHGSVLPGDTGRKMTDDDADRRNNSIRFGARPYHGRFGVEHYLPIPMPVKDYQSLTAEYLPWIGMGKSGRRFRIAHSPTRREIKGTNDLLAAVDYLVMHEGLPIEVVLIENMDHGEALKLKASCDATFDSFWLGMQGSGMEAASMMQVVIAGDETAAAEAAALNEGVIPWTFANNKEELVTVLRNLLRDPSYWASEALRVHEYVKRVHDYLAVGAKYRDILCQELGRGAAND